MQQGEAEEPDRGEQEQRVALHAAGSGRSAAAPPASPVTSAMPLTAPSTTFWSTYVVGEAPEPTRAARRRTLTTASITFWLTQYDAAGDRALDRRRR